MYDRMRTSRRTLLPKVEQSKLKRKSLVIEALADIYLCEKCDGEFNHIVDIKDHERMCLQQEPYITSQEVNTSLDLFSSNQVLFMKQFGLVTTAESQNYTRVFNQEKFKAMLQRMPKSRYSIIPTSSSLGQLLYGESQTIDSSYEVPYEVHCCNVRSTINGILNDKKTKKWRVSWKPTLKARNENNFFHMYCFTRLQREDRLLTISTGLNERSRLLLMRCGRCSVVLKRFKVEARKRLQQEIHKEICKQIGINKFKSCVNNPVKKQHRKKRSSITKVHRIITHDKSASVRDTFLQRSSNITQDCTKRKDLEHFRFNITASVIDTSQRQSLSLQCRSQNILDYKFTPTDIKCKLSITDASTIPVVDLCSSEEESDVLKPMADLQSSGNKNQESFPLPMKIDRRFYKLEKVDDEISLKYYEHANSNRFLNRYYS